MTDQTENTDTGSVSSSASCEQGEDTEEIYLKVVVGLRTTQKERVIGPYTFEELDEYGQPKDNTEFENAVWQMIDAGMEQISKEEAEQQGLSWW